MVSDEAETSAELSLVSTMSLIQWLCAWTWLRKVVLPGLEESVSEKLRSHEQTTPSRPAE